MDLLINVGMAWVTVILMILLLVVYLLRKIIQRMKLPKDSWLRTLNKKLRKPHKWLGVAALVTGLIHGLYSSLPILSGNKGTILFVVMILMGLSFMFRKHLKAWQPWIKVHRWLAIASMALLLLHLVEVDWFVGFETVKNAVQRDLDTFADEQGSGEGFKSRKGQHGASEPLEVNEAVIDANGSNLMDGTYVGVADGFGPDLTVEVVVEKGAIASVLVTDHNEEKKEFWGVPVEEIPLAIVEAQSTDVDIVSGATYTSVGIMNAVEDALSKAINDTEVGTSPEKETTATPTIAETTEAPATTAGQLEVLASGMADGVYTGTARGFRPGLVVEVTVESEMVTLVDVVDHNEEKEVYWGRPIREIPLAIVESQSTEVDIVTGATYTSIGIMDAVENALSQGK